jgi:hypothetical protein
MTHSLNQIIERIVKDDELHARWLNTLSMMENTGARKISASENKSKVTLMVLKHAAEEARHAYYLKKQIERLGFEDFFINYNPEYLISAFDSLQYLPRLDVELCRYLRNEMHLKRDNLNFGAYLLVTYAIEVRAGELYPIYQDILTAHHSKVTVKSIIIEEETHLEEMLNQMKEFFGTRMLEMASMAQKIEQKYFERWIVSLNQELKLEKIELMGESAL